MGYEGWGIRFSTHTATSSTAEEVVGFLCHKVESYVSFSMPSTSRSGSYFKLSGIVHCMKPKGGNPIRGPISGATVYLQQYYTKDAPTLEWWCGTIGWFPATNAYENYLGYVKPYSWSKTVPRIYDFRTVYKVTGNTRRLPAWITMLGCIREGRVPLSVGNSDKADVKSVTVVEVWAEFKHRGSSTALRMILQ